MGDDGLTGPREDPGQTESARSAETAPRAGVARVEHEQPVVIVVWHVERGELGQRDRPAKRFGQTIRDSSGHRPSWPACDATQTRS